MAARLCHEKAGGTGRSWNPAGAGKVSSGKFGSGRKPLKRLLLTLPALLLATSILAADAKLVAPSLGVKAEKLIAESLPVCSVPSTPTRTALAHKLPDNMVGNVIQLDSTRGACQGQWVTILSNEGGFYMGVPWFLDDVQGTIEEKLQQFTWKNMQENYTAVVDRTKTREGLYRVKLLMTTERGKMPMEGEIDPAGTVFFIGHFHPLSEAGRTARLKELDHYIAGSPATGAARPEVTVIEFSDFQCPSCQHASKYLKPIMATHADKVRYIRYDVPLVSMHPWAFAAAVAGRAIYHQKPELFWQFKEQVYDNQEKLSAFTLDDFARGFASDHELDLKRYDADIASPELKSEILSGVGLAFTNDVRSTPTYIVNGTFVDPGVDGVALEKYVTGLLKK